MPRATRWLSALVSVALFMSLLQAQAQSVATANDDLAARLVAAPDDNARAAILGTAVPDADLLRAVVRQANTQQAQGQPDTALSALRYALGWAQNIRQPSVEAQARLGLGSIFYSQSAYAQARPEFQQALTQGETLNDSATIARAWSGLGLIQRSQGDYPVALTSLTHALAASRASGDKILETKQLSSLGTLYFLQGDYARAEDYYSQARVLLAVHNDPESAASMHQNRGNINIQQGRYAAALADFQVALALRESLKLVSGIADSLLSIGQVYRYQGNTQQSLDYFQRTLPLRAQTRDKRGQALALTNISAIYSDTGDFTKALPYMQQARALYEETNDQDKIAQSLNNLSIIYDGLHNAPAALEYAERALALYETMGNQRGLADTLNNLSDLYHQRGDDVQALRALQRTIELSRANNYVRLLWQGLTNIGLLYLSQKHYPEAQQSFTEAIEIIENMRAQSFGTEQERSNFFRGKLEAYKALSYTLLQQGQEGAALAAAESAKGRVLLDVLRNGRAGISKNLTPEEKDREKQAFDALGQANTEYLRAVRSNAPAARLKPLAERQNAARYALTTVQTALYAAHPVLQAQRGETPPLSLAQAGDLLHDADTALLEFVVMDERAWLFVLTRTPDGPPSLKTYLLPRTGPELSAAAARFRQMLAQRDLAFQETARDLYTQLLQPAAAQLAGKKSLIIVPDGGLWDLPFHALQTPEGRYVIENYAVSYAPSLTVLREMKRSRDAPERKPAPAAMLLAFGNPALTATGRVTPGKHRTPDAVTLTAEANADLSPLPETERQIRELRVLYGAAHSKIYLGAAAQEARAKAQAGSYRILQFATHGVLSDANPLQSYVLLSQAGNAPGEDGRLEAREMMDLNLHADLVVLSACETARGQARAGEGFIGMTWALFVAGAPATVASQWQVESSSTTALMLEFHRRLQSKFNGPAANAPTTAEALRQAQSKLLNSNAYRHPFYWAGFVLIGDER